MKFIFILLDLVFHLLSHYNNQKQLDNSTFKIELEQFLIWKHNKYKET